MNCFDICKLQNILKRIKIKRQYLNIVLPDLNYIEFIEDLEEFNLIISGLGNLHVVETVSINRVRTVFRNVNENHQKLLEKLCAEKNEIQKFSEEFLLEKFMKNINNCKINIYRSVEICINDILAATANLYDIKYIIRVHDELSLLKTCLNVALKNLENFLKSACRLFVRQIQHNIYKIAIININAKFDSTFQIFQNYREFNLKKFNPQIVIRMEDKQRTKTNGSESEIMEKIEEQLVQHRKDIKVTVSEANALRKEKFASEISLGTQENTTRTEMKTKKQEAHATMKTIDELRSQMSSMENEIDRLNVTQSSIQVEIDKMSANLDDVLLEIVHLEAVLKSIDRDINIESSSFNSNLKNYEAKRDDILINPNLTQEQKDALFNDLDKSFQDFKGQHVERMKLLEERKSDIMKMTKLQTDSYISMKKDLESKHGQLRDNSSGIKRKDKFLKEYEDTDSSISDELGEYESGRELQTETGESLDAEVSKSESSIQSIDVRQLSDEEYIKQHLGDALKQALASMILYQPTDQIYYLGNYLTYYNGFSDRIKKRQQETEAFEAMRGQSVKIANEEASRNQLDPRKRCNPCVKL